MSRGCAALSLVGAVLSLSLSLLLGAGWEVCASACREDRTLTPRVLVPPARPPENGAAQIIGQDNNDPKKSIQVANEDAWKSLGKGASNSGPAPAEGNNQAWNDFVKQEEAKKNRVRAVTRARRRGAPRTSRADG